MKSWGIVAAVAAGALIASPAMAKGEEASHGHGKATKEQVVEIAVTGEGFVPAQAKVKAGKPVKLVVTRKTERTCATEVVLKDFGIKKALPLNQPVEVTFTPTKSGQVRYACAMDMIAGALTVE